MDPVNYYIGPNGEKIDLGGEITPDTVLPPLVLNLSPAPKQPAIQVGHPYLGAQGARPFQPLPGPSESPALDAGPPSSPSAASPSGAAAATALGSAPPPAKVPAPAQAPQDDEELKDEQETASKSAGLSHLGGLLDSAMRIMTPGLEGSSNPAFAEHEKSAHQRVQDLIQRRDQLRQMAADKLQHDRGDQNSPISKAYQKMAVAKGMVTPEMAKDLSADMFEALSKGATLEEAKREHDLRQQEIEDQRRTQAAAQAEAARHNREMEAIDWAKLGEKKGADKALQDKTAKEMENDIQAVPKISELQTAQHSAGPTHLLNWQDYSNLVDAYKGSVAPAIDPGSRNNLQLIEGVKKQLPSGMTRDAAGDIQWNNYRKQIIQRVNGQINVAEASGKYSPGQIARLRQEAAQYFAGVNPETGELLNSPGAQKSHVLPVKQSPIPMPTVKPEAPAAPALPVKATVSEPQAPPGIVDGSPQPVMVRVVSPDGVPGRLPAIKLQDALKKGYRYVGKG